MAVSRFVPSLPSTCNERIDRLFRNESGRAVAILARIFNDFDRAEDAVQDAYVTALATWPKSGFPKNTAAWIVSTARNSAIDRIRREKTAAEKYELIGRLSAIESSDDEEPTMDDRLGMIFAACHPALSEETRIVLTLRFAAGLTVAEIATALLTPETTIAQRLVRAKKKIREARIPFDVPEDRALPERMRDVLRVVYCIFNEGYASATNVSRVRAELCEEALRLATLLERLLPAEPEIEGLHALFLFHDARRTTRVDAHGDPVLLEDQDRALWDARKIVEGLTVLDRAGRHRAVGPYQLQAMIAAEHARAATWKDTNWFRIRECYDRLLELEPSPVIALNRAVAIAFTDGPSAAIGEIDAIEAGGPLRNYAPLFAARAELLCKSGDARRAKRDFETAIRLSQSAPERRFLERRRNALAN